MKSGIKKGGRSIGAFYGIGKITLPMILTSSFHEPVLLSRVIESLGIKKDKKYIDATLGGGGYTDEILKSGGIVLGIDQDQDAIDFVRQKFQTGKELFLEQGNFGDLKKIAHKYGFDEVGGIIFDLGMSTYQLENSGRGFSYQRDEQLDMRMDKRNELTASEVINSYSREKLYEIFTKYAEELNSGAIAGAIVRARTVKRISTTGGLAKLIEEILDRVIGRESGYQKLKLCQETKARIFQALRIEVNDELGNLNRGLKDGIDLLESGGRIAVLSYHSLEDRRVKLVFKKEAGSGRLKIINSEIYRALRQERQENPKARSAKLRIAEKIAYD